MNDSLWSFITQSTAASGGVEIGVLVLLLLLSVFSWCIILMKGVDLLGVRRKNERFLKILSQAPDFGTVAAASSTIEDSTLARVFRAAMAALEQRAAAGEHAAVSDPRKIPLTPPANAAEAVTLSMQHASTNEIQRLEKGLGYLATTGSVSPFIGLFGTVWGIMATFHSLGMATTTSLAVVAPGISSALIATAAGLAVAIPAVVAFNLFQTRLDILNEQMQQFIERTDALIRASGYARSAERAAVPAPQAPPAPQVPQAPPAPPAKNLASSTVQSGGA
ncbi:MAG: MotA/TolQ/ExbB proton channel family protein [Planctomycetes bacterium]|nr:MotA/TolQ/ExbB proton channel family protein [Planctomycetota bacterium]